MTNYRVYEGKQIFQLNEDKIEALVEGLLYENDYIMIAAPPKAYKSIFAMQLSCNLSSGTPFLEVLDVPKAVNVLYFATEGKDEDIKDRFIRISHKVRTDKERLRLICSAGFRFNTKRGLRELEEIIRLCKKLPPKVIVIDAMYMAIAGSLIKDDVVNNFHMIVKQFAEKFDAAVIIVHHMKKGLRNYKDGLYFNRTDDDVYGSQFLLGAVDHCIWLEKIRKEPAPMDRFMHCDTQRGGQIVTDLRLRLSEPDPLYLSIVDNNSAEKEKILQILVETKKAAGITELIKQSKICRSKVYQCLKGLQEDGKVIKSGGKVKLYEVKHTD